MRFKEYLKDKIIYISLLVFAVITIEIFLIPYDMQIFIKIYINIGLFIYDNYIYFFIRWYSIIDKCHNDRWECVAIVSWINYLQ